MGSPALIEVLARDGSVRQSLKVNAWPLRVGRALDNDLVLDDAHTAAHHFQVEIDEQGRVMVVAADTINGLQIDGRTLAPGARFDAQGTGEPLLLQAGHTRLRLRLDGHALPPERPLVAAQALIHGVGSLSLAVLFAVAVYGFHSYLASDPGGLARALASRFVGLLGVLLAWCGVWTLLSKVFNHHGHFGWHLRVLMFGVLGWNAIDAAAALLAFAFSWPWASDYDFIAKLSVMAAALYFHLQAVEPHRRFLTRALSLAALTTALGLSLWGHWQNSSRLGAELYMSHLFPPAFRVAAPVDVDTFMQGLDSTRETLDEHAGKAAD